MSAIKTYWVIQWIVIYSLDSATQPLNNWGVKVDDKGRELHWVQKDMYTYHTRFWHKLFSDKRLVNSSALL